jgi:hypothetical protein
MKNLILMLVILSSFTAACKKGGEPAPAKTTTVVVHDTVYINQPPAGEQHYKFYWDYHISGDPTTYSAFGCLTQGEMDQKIIVQGVFNVVKSVECTP